MTRSDLIIKLAASQRQLTASDADTGATIGAGVRKGIQLLGADPDGSIRGAVPRREDSHDAVARIDSHATKYHAMTPDII